MKRASRCVSKQSEQSEPEGRVGGHALHKSSVTVTRTGTAPNFRKDTKRCGRDADRDRGSGRGIEKQSGRETEMGKTSDKTKPWQSYVRRI